MVSPKSHSNPYVGPTAYQRDDEKHHFFGRDREAKTLLSLIVSKPIVLFCAQSGAGKTSLVNARVIPDLEKKGFKVFQVARVCGELPAEITPDEVENIYVFNALWYLSGLEGDLRSLSKMSLQEFFTQESADPDKVDQPRVLILDQFEEILTTHPEFSHQREEFFQQVRRSLHADPNLSVLFVIREDHLAGLDRYAPLLPGRLRTRFRMERLRSEDAIKAVKRPAEKAGRPFEPGVAEALVDNMRQIRLAGQEATAYGEYVEPVQLQVVCFQLWKDLLDSPGETITQKNVDDFGNVDQALEKFYESAVKRVALKTRIPEEQIRRWFGKELITPSLIRGQVNREADRTGGLPNEAVDKLVNEHLIRAEKVRGGTWYELVHDRFIHPILGSNESWLAEHGSSLSKIARDWDKKDRNETFLFRGKHLEEAEKWAKANEGWIGNLERAFVEASKEEQEKEKKEKEEQNRREMEAKGKLAAEQQRAEEQTKIAMRNRRFVIVLLVVSLAAVGFACWALTAEKKAESTRYMAVAHSLIKDSLGQREGNEHELGALLAVQAYRFCDASKDQIGDRFWENVVNQVCMELDKALQDPYFSHRLRGHIDSVRSVAPSRKTHLIASGSGDGTVRVWNLQKASRPPIVKQFQSEGISSVVFSSNEKILAVSTENGIVWLWAWQNSELEPVALHGHKNDILSIAFSLDGELLALGSKDKTVRLWNVQDPRKPVLLTCNDGGTPVLLDHNDGVTSVAFSPDGKTLASGSKDKTIRLWNVEDLKAPALLSVLRDHNDGVTSVAFSPDGKTLASGSKDKTIRLWNVEDLKAPALLSVLRDHKDEVTSVAFSPDGELLASGSKDKTVRLWNVQAINPDPIISLYAHKNSVLSVAFTRYELVSGSADWNVRVWDLQSLLRQERGKPRPESKKLDLANMESKDKMAKTESLVDEICKKVWSNLTLKEWDDFVRSDIPYEPTCSNETFRLIEAWKNVGRNGRVKEAVEQLSSVYEKDPDAMKYAFAIGPDSSLNLQDKLTNIKKAWKSFEEGQKSIANKYDVDGGIECFDKALADDPDLKLEIAQEKKRLGELLVEKAKEFAIAGDVDNGTELFAKALKLYPDLDGTIKEAKRNAAQKLAGEAVDNIIDSEVNKAIAIYKKAENLDPTLRKSGPLLNNLCLWGSLWKKPGDVMSFCDRAVGMDPSGGSYSSRAIARALTGDVTGAIKDFEAFLGWAREHPELGIDATGPQKWLDVLKKDHQITSEMVEETRNQFIEMEELKQSGAMSVSSRQSAVDTQ